ncbi:MAG: hypothetical protein BWZ02_03070 [Lentisphaerae bacterium ADurb.BinA184]|nr:MAG: hypothetical protein BWZ02_03070 [Lentisphaerae bacterium ADurb.BinA184]
MRPIFDIRIVRSPDAPYYEDELLAGQDYYPDPYLAAVHDKGFNGIWLHALLRDLVRTDVFPDMDEAATRRRRQDKLKRLIERAARRHVGVYLYLCEPRGFRCDHAFFQRHPETRGTLGVSPMDDWMISPTQPPGEYGALCTSVPAVREFLEEAAGRLFTECRGLAGAFLITASEHLTHCRSHEGWGTSAPCPRCCPARDAAEVVAEVINLIHRGARRADPASRIIAWNWAWNQFRDPQTQAAIIERADRDVIIMADWERIGRKRVGRRTVKVDEYSLSYLGPSPTFRKVLAEARRHGHRVMAKLQLANTHEIVTVPHIPVPFNVGAKMKRMAAHGVDGYLGCWIFGGNLGLMTEVAGRMSFAPQPRPSALLRQLAVRDFGPAAAPHVLRAWRQFSRAWGLYPFCIPFLYFGPVNYAVAYPLTRPRPADQGGSPSWIALPRDAEGRLCPGGRTKNWAGPFTPGELAAALKRLARAWSAGLAELRSAQTIAPANEALAREAGIAEIILLNLEAAANLIRYERLATPGQPPRRLNPALRALLGDERRLTARALELVRNDPRLGFHSEAHCHLYTPADLEAKLRDLDALLGPAGRRHRRP